MAVIANDPFKAWPDSPIRQARKIRQITPDDVNELKSVPKALRIITDGNICVEPADGYEQLDGTPIAGGRIIAVLSGQVVDWIQVRKVYATGTTATLEALC